MQSFIFLWKCENFLEQVKFKIIYLQPNIFKDKVIPDKDTVTLKSNVNYEICQQNLTKKCVKNVKVKGPLKAGDKLMKVVGKMCECLPKVGKQTKYKDIRPV